MAITKLIADSITSGAIANTPAFSVYPSSATSLSDVTNTKIAFNTEILDTDSAFNTSTNRFTVPSGKGGYYQINLKAVFEELGGEFSQVVLMLYKNGSNISEDNIYSGGLGSGFGTTERWSRSISRIVYLNAGDYVEGFAYINETSGNAGEVSATQDRTTFDGYRLIGI